MKFPFNAPLTITVLSWGFNFVALKVLYREMSAPVVGLLRYLLMFGVLVGICLIQKESLKPARRDFWHIQAVGFLAMGLYMVLVLEGIRFTSPAVCAILLATAPVWTYLLSCGFRQERFQLSAMLGAVVAFGGVTLVILGGAAAGHGTLYGDIIVLISAFVWACSAVLMKPLLSRYKPTTVLTMSMPGALPVLIPYGLGATLNTNYAAISATGWFMFATTVLMSGVVAFICFYTGLRQIGASGAALYQYLVPPTAALFAWALMGKSLGPIQFVGLAVVLIGVAYAGRARQVAPPLE